MKENEIRGRDVPLGVPEFVDDYISRFEISQTTKIVSQMQIGMDDCVVQFSVITKEVSSDSISSKDLLIGFVVM